MTRRTRTPARWLSVLLFALTLLLGAPVSDAAEGDEKDEKKDAGPPMEAEARAEWVAKLVGMARGDDATQRRAALASLAKHDKAGDCLQPVVGLLSETGLSEDALVDTLRVVSIPGFDDAAAAILPLLPHASATVRGNAAVALEYIGAHGAVDDLKKQLADEKIAAVRNHLCRALGRCGAGESGVRSLLLRILGKTEGDFDRIGPVVGLSYFEGDKKVVRSLEGRLAKSIVKKGIGSGLVVDRKLPRLLGWCLSEVGGPKTAAFIRKKVIERLHRQTTLGSEVSFFDAVARKLEGDPSAQKAIDDAVYGLANLGAGLGTTSISRSTSFSLFEMDEMRAGRDRSRFRPKGDPAAPPPPVVARREGAR